ncbi:hypothetical protein J5A68_02645 [Prevotella melaninogenica]|uniref:hypothetical protein n=1 Tax=Prevotella melaninogenica TaxID=28132 RepID=UPI001BA4B51C|nr:hypothetical protein [Prevotella melaninogenica]QUB68623.1 hypothetical protein J5A68_02645 [Prevotella melaninogenica]
MDIIDIGGIIADFVRVGYNAAVKDYDPPQDRLRQSEVKKWLKFRKIDFKTFKELEKQGLIHARKGDAVNSPLYYSKKEIHEAFATMRLNRLIITNELKDYDID